MKNVTLVALALSLTLAACSDSNTGTVSFALTARQAAAPAASAAFSNAAAAPSVAAAGDSTVIMLGNDSIIIRSAQLVSVAAPPGTFNALEFEIHKPSSSEDAAFIAANPDFAAISIRVTGTYSQAGTRSSFTFTSDLDQSEEASLVPPVTAQNGQGLTVTLRADISGWYVNAAKTALVDPASANKGGANESVVANNIQNSFNAFEDDNHDGLEG